MKVAFDRLVGPEYMLAAMRTTTGKDMYKMDTPKLETWYKMLLSPHSSHRAVIYRFFVEDIPYFAHVYLTRHHVGIQPHVYSQRDDKGEIDKTPRNNKPQGELISMCFDVNAAALLQIAQRRMCFQAHKVIRQTMELIKKVLIQHGDSYDKVLGKLMMRPCQLYYGICPEPEPCGKVPAVTTLVDIHKYIMEDDNG